TEPLKSYYHRPSYPDLQIEEQGKFTQASDQNGTIYEWDIDSMNKYHIINKLQKMIMANNAYKIKNTYDKIVANLLIAGFTDQLKGWWDNVLTIQQQIEILESVERLTPSNGEKLNVKWKISEAHICNEGICFKQTFILVKYLEIGIIFGQSFLEMIKPFKVKNKGITTKLL
ncbi:hypothetical protein CFOL_v3_08590, partial [Cephalotus follicularis]